MHNIRSLEFQFLLKCRTRNDRWYVSSHIFK